MSIRHMLPLGTVQRRCIVCNYPIHASSDELTAHETKCLNIPEGKIDRMLEVAERRVEALRIQKNIHAINAKIEMLGEPQKADDAQPSVVHPAPLP